MVAGGIDFSKKYICTLCGSQKEPVWAKRGSGYIEILMWLAYIVPGMIYTLWRLLRKHQVCQNCSQPTVIPINSAQGTHLRLLMKSLSQAAVKKTADNQTQKP